MATLDTEQRMPQDTIMEKKMEAMTLGDVDSTAIADPIPNSTQWFSSVVKVPFVKPVESAKPKAVAELTADQQIKFKKLLETVKGWKEIPSTTGKGGSIVESEIMWLTRECLLRYLRATKWNTSEAAKRVLETLSWRRDYGVDSLLDGKISSPENETGKQIILGYDIAARPCHYLNPGRQNTQPSPRQVQHLVFMVERVIDLMVPGQESLALLINFKSSKTRTNTAPGIGQGREVLNILQTHYPERLGRALIINGMCSQVSFIVFGARVATVQLSRPWLTLIVVPWVVWGFFKLITPFIDPLTREKLKFNEDVRQFVPPEQLWKEFGGDVDFEYDHVTYWPALLKLCEEKRAEQKARWEKAGKQYGESETYLKAGDDPKDILATTSYSS